MLRARLAARRAVRFSSLARSNGKRFVPPLVPRHGDIVTERSLPFRTNAIPLNFEVNSLDTLPLAGKNGSLTATYNLSDEFSNFAISPQTSRNNVPRRISINSRLKTGIQKRRTIRAFSTNGSPNPRRTPMKAASSQAVSPTTHSTKNGTDTSATPVKAVSEKSSSAKSSNRLTWRDALKSPMKALRYSNQLRLDFVGWLKHMWAGARLLAADVRVSAGILRRITNGKQITRRQRNFIVQTGVDLARLVPFSLFLIIPLAEFALPFALRLFPNMLPSQFQDDMKKEEDMKRRLKGRIEIAKYLREVVEEKAKSIKTSSDDSELQQDAESLENFIDSIRSGNPVDSGEVSKFARLFNDEITIDGAARPQLVAMCKYMGLSPYGHDQFLRFKLRSRLNNIKKDDMEIMWEGGVNSLTDDEIVKACQDRGIQVIGIPKKVLREQLHGWLDLSQRREIPSSLLIMSRAFFYTGSDGLKETLGSLPEEVIMDVKSAAASESGATNQERLDEARRQAKLIAMESEAEERKEREDEERRKKKEELSAADGVVDGQEESQDPEMAKAEALESEMKKEFFAAADERQSAEEKVVDDAAPVEPVMDEEELHKEQDDIRKLLVSLGELSSESAVEKEREELANLKAELAGVEAVVKESGNATGLDLRRFKTLVRKLEREVEKVDAVVGLRMKLLDQDNDGLMSFEECKNIMGVIAGNPDDALVAETLRRLDADADGNISKADLARLLKELQGETSALDKPPVSTQPNS